MKHPLRWFVVALAVAGVPLAAQAAGNAGKELSTAQAHALMAEAATTIGMAHTHLHHVVNCLVGPKGEGFDAAAGDPCKGQGDGALSDSSGNAMHHKQAEAALASAQAGLKATTLKAIHADAKSAAGALRQAAPAASSKSSGGGW